MLTAQRQELPSRWRDACRVVREEEGKTMLRRWTVWLAVLGTVAFLLGVPALADDKAPDATIRLSEGSVAAGISCSWGRGEVSFQGKTYHVKVDGLSVAEVG